jgi:mitochondrial fission protein ELM1
LAYAVWWHQKPEPIFHKLLGAADCNFVTHDSMSMINECISAERPLVVLEVGRGRPDMRYNNVLEKFTRLGFCRRLQVDAEFDRVPKMFAPAREYHNALVKEILGRLSIS